VVSSFEYTDIIALNNSGEILQIFLVDNKSHVVQTIAETVFELIKDHMTKMKAHSNYAIALSNHMVENDPELLSFKKETAIFITRQFPAHRCFSLFLVCQEERKKGQEGDPHQARRLFSPWASLWGPTARRTRCGGRATCFQTPRTWPCCLPSTSRCSAAR
jgi:hypothetical protein